MALRLDSRAVRGSVEPVTAHGPWEDAGALPVLRKYWIRDELTPLRDRRRTLAIEPNDVRKMLAWENSGFSVEAPACRATALRYSMAGLSEIAADGNRRGDVPSWATVLGHSMSGLWNIAADRSRRGDVSSWPTAEVSGTSALVTSSLHARPLPRSSHCPHTPSNASSTSIRSTTSRGTSASPYRAPHSCPAMDAVESESPS